MKRWFISSLFILICSVALCQNNVLVIDEGSFTPVNYDALSGLAIDPIGLDRSKRKCIRIKMHVNRMTAGDIEKLQVVPIGGNVMVMKQYVSVEGNGLIIEMTAQPSVRFYLRHERYGDSNEVTITPQPDKEYRMEAWCSDLQTIIVNCNVAGADVHIDDKYAGKISSENNIISIRDVATGEHVVRVSAYGETAEQKISVSSDKASYYVIKLAEIKYVSIVSEPAGADIYIDGKYIGPSPLHQYPLSSREHTLEAVNGSVRKSIVLEALDSRKDLYFDVRTVFPVTIAAEGNGSESARIQVDGSLYDNPCSLNLSQGVHQVLIYGYKGRQSSKKIEVGKDGRNSFVFPYPGRSASAANSWWNSGEDGKFSIVPLFSINTREPEEVGYGAMLVFRKRVCKPYLKFVATPNAFSPWDGYSYSGYSATAGMQFTIIAGGPYLGLGYGKRIYSSSAVASDMDIDLGYMVRIKRFRLVVGVTMPATDVVDLLSEEDYSGGDSSTGTSVDSFYSLDVHFGIGLIF